MQLHPTPFKIEDSAFFMPGPETISVPPQEPYPVHGQAVQAAQATKATQAPESALEANAKSIEQEEMEKIKYEVEQNLVQMARMSRQNEELLKIFLCKEVMEREAREIEESWGF